MHWPPQREKPASHCTLHCPLAQTGTPFGTGGQTVPHPPQLRASVAVVTHSLPQRKNPV
jgi:hypothetical protein